jgi:hypothetical protein
VVVAAFLLDTAPARACLSFNIHRVSRAAGGLGDPLEILLRETGSAISVEGFSEIQISNTGATFKNAATFTNTPDVPAGNQIFGPDLVAMNFVAGQEISASDPTSGPSGAESVGMYQSFALGMISVDVANLSTNGNRAMESIDPGARLTDDSGDLFRPKIAIPRNLRSAASGYESFARPPSC